MNTTELLVTGCYTEAMGGHGTGLTSYRRDPMDGSLSRLGELALPSPSYVIRHPSLPLLYTANEAGEEGSVSVVAVAPDGTLHELARVPSQGGSPCHLAVGEDARRLGVANYGTGSALFLELGADGLPTGATRLWTGDARAVGPHQERQEAPHAHMVVPGPQGLWHVVDLGTDQLLAGPGGGPAAETVSTLPDGTGPRQLVRGADGSAYVVGELDSRLHVLRETEPGRYTTLGSVPVGASAPAGNFPAHLSMSADGARLYLSNRGADTIAVFDTVPGDMPRAVGEFPCGGAWPRHMELVGDHLYVSNERSDTLTVHALAPGTGVPTVRHQYPTASPTCAVALSLD